jgi:predicted Zn-dependent protease
MKHRSTWALLLASVFAVSACADLRRSTKKNKSAAERKAPLRQGTTAWPLAALVGHTTPYIELRDRQQQAAETVSTASLRLYAEVARRLEAVTDLRPYYLLMDGSAPNAFAWSERDFPVIAVNIGMLETLDEDPDLWAAVIGHEIAHLKLRHQAQRQDRQSTAKTATGALGFAFALVGIPFGLMVADGAATAIGRGYSRDDERDADTAAVAYMRQAGFDPQGALRFHALLASLDSQSSAGLFSTHPTGEERVANMRALIEVEAQGSTVK